MMDTLFNMVWLKSAFVTSSVCLILGWAGLRLWHRHAARAYQMLWLCVLAAMLVPILSLAVHELNMGILPAESHGLAMHAWWSPASVRSTASHIPEATASASSPQATSQSIGQPAPEPAEALSTPVWEDLIAWIWPFVTVVFLLRVVAAFVSGVLRVKRAQPVEALPNGVDLPGLKASLGIRRQVRVAVSDTVGCPVVWGWTRSINIIVPKGFLDGRPVMDLNAILCHELAHAKRRDHVSGLLSELAVCCMPWQPLMWWARRQLVTLSEHACDDWVVACGYREADYAESLLDMLPQRQYAFTPAVATHASSLAVRIKRILARQCSNPRQGRAWTCLAASLVLLVSLGVAFAQVKEDASNRDSEHQCKFCQNNKYHHYEAAVHGMVFDPNGDPVSEALVTVMPMTGFPAETNSEGHFTEIPYTRDWCVDGKVTLLARDKRHNWATSVQVAYPADNVTIHMIGGVVISGKVVDVAGEPVQYAQVYMDWIGPYTCPMPVCWGQTDKQGVFSLAAVPADQDYTVTVSSDNGRQRSEATSINTRNLDDHRIILPDIPVISELPSSTDAQEVPTWKGSFDAVYSLHEGEAAKFIKAPFMMERQHFSLNTQWHLNTAVKNRFSTSLENQFAHFIFSWNGGLVDRGGYGDNAWPVKTALQIALFIEPYEFKIAENLPKLDTLPHGDWICDTNAPVEQRLRVMETLIQQELGRTVRFEKQVMDRDTVVATGSYQFKPLAGMPDPNVVCLVASENDKGVDENKQVATLDEFLRCLGQRIDMPVLNQTDVSMAISIRYKDTAAAWFGLGNDDTLDQIHYLLQNLSKQTGLQFKIESRPREVWVLTEDL